MGLVTWGNIIYGGPGPLGPDGFSPLAKFTTVKMALLDCRCTTFEKNQTSQIRIRTKNNFWTQKIFFTHRACGLQEKKMAKKWSDFDENWRAHRPNFWLLPRKILLKSDNFQWRLVASNLSDFEKILRGNSQKFGLCACQFLSKSDYFLAIFFLWRPHAWRVKNFFFAKKFFFVQIFIRDVQFFSKVVHLQSRSAIFIVVNLASGLKPSGPRGPGPL